MPAAGYQRGNFVLFTLALLVMLEVCGVQGCHTGSGSECEKAPFVPGHNLAGEGFDVVRMRRTGAYVINVKGQPADHHTCTLCPNRFQQGQVGTVKLFFSSYSFSHGLLLSVAPPVLFFLPLFYSTLPLTIFPSTCILLYILPFLSSSDSEAPCSGARLASLQPLQQAALQCPPPLCGLPAAQRQLPG